MQPEARTDYRREKNAQGDAYRAWILEDMGYDGDTRLGIEIKNDAGLGFGRLWIEVAEKKDSLTTSAMMPSGIYAAAPHVWGYWQGDYSRGWLFKVRVLQRLHQSGRYEARASKAGTSRGFLLPIEDADRFCIHRKDLLSGESRGGTIYESEA